MKKILLVVVILILSSIFAIKFISNNDEDTIAHNYVMTEKEMTLEDYRAINEDVVMLIELNEYLIPIVNNDKYFKLDIYGNYDSLGTPYIDSRSASNNLLIQGHSSKKNDLMFTSLKRVYENDLMEYEIKIHTSEGITIYKPISLISVNLNDDDPYLRWYDTDYRNHDDFLDYIDDMKYRSLVKFDNDISSEDNIVTLITCDRRYDDARLIMIMSSFN